MRIVVARCSVDYDGRLTAHLPEAVRVLMVKADGSVLVHADGGSYKPLNWMSPPCALVIDDDDAIRDALAWLLRSRLVNRSTLRCMPLPLFSSAFSTRLWSLTAAKPQTI